MKPTRAVPTGPQPRHGGAPRSPDHARFASYLRHRMESRGATRNSLAAALGVTATMVGYWRLGRYLPAPDKAERLAEELDDARILTYVMQARTRRCGNCGRTFDTMQTRAMYCTLDCQRRAHMKGGRRYDARQEAIDAMCRGCEPEGLCRDDGCALRPFSPFLVVARKVA